MGYNTYDKAIAKADAELTKVAQHAMDKIYFATCLTLHRFFGWGELRITRFMDVAQEVFMEVAGKSDLSLVELCDTEVGIEFRSTKNESYTDTPYLCQAKWNEIRPEFDKKPNAYKMAWIVRMKQKMKDWMFPQIMASVALGLYRKEKWGAQRIQELVNHIMDDIFYEFGDDTVAMCEAVKNETGLEYVHTSGGELALLEKKKHE